MCLCLPLTHTNTRTQAFSGLFTTAARVFVHLFSHNLHRVLVLHALESSEQQTRRCIATAFSLSKQSNLFSSVLIASSFLFLIAFYYYYCFGTRGQAVHRSHFNLRPMIQWEACRGTVFGVPVHFSVCSVLFSWLLAN